MAVAYANQFRPIQAGDVLPLTVTATAFRAGGQSVRKLPDSVLMEIASAQLAPVSDALIPAGMHRGKALRDLSTAELDAIADVSKPDNDDPLSDLAWIRENARRELRWRASQLARGELDRRGLPHDRENFRQPWKG